MRRSNKPSTLRDIRNPLVFFALALLVIEAIFGGVVAYSRMSPTLTFAAICVMAFLFVLVVGVVAFITIYWPHHLYEQVRREMRSTKEMSEFFKSRAFREIVRRIVRDIMDKEVASGKDENGPE